MKEYIKKDEITLTVREVLEPVVREQNYDLEYLANEEQAILKAIDDKNIELAGVRKMITEASKLGIKEKLSEEVISEENVK